MQWVLTRATFGEGEETSSRWKAGHQSKPLDTLYVVSRA